MTICCIHNHRRRHINVRTHQAAPVKPHDPQDRIILGTIGARAVSTIMARWEVRALDPAGPFHHYFAKNEMLHLQFWNPYFGISLLTPSKLTANRFEAFPLKEWKLASKSFENIRVQLERAFATRLPTESVVRKLTDEFREAVTSGMEQTIYLDAEQQQHG